MGYLRRVFAERSSPSVGVEGPSYGHRYATDEGDLTLELVFGPHVFGVETPFAEVAASDM